jgi:uncharacterized membrane-anchored protein YhcB (DUF1043 family)
MFQKIKDIKKYIRLAKIGGVIVGTLFILLIANNIFQQIQIQQLQEKVELLEKR